MEQETIEKARKYEEIQKKVWLLYKEGSVLEKAVAKAFIQMFMFEETVTGVGK